MSLSFLSIVKLQNFSLLLVWLSKTLLAIIIIHNILQPLTKHHPMKHIANLAAVKAYRPKPLTQQSHSALSKILTNFTLKNTHLVYQYNFPANNYLQTLQKMNRIGLIADEMDHHPQWTLNGDNLSIGLSTHEIGGEVSLKDYILGFWIEGILKETGLQEQVVGKWNQLNINYD